MRKLIRLLLCTLIMLMVASSVLVGDATAIVGLGRGCVSYIPPIQQHKPDVVIKEYDNGKGEATILIPFENEDKSWWEFWKDDYVYREAKIPTKDLPKQDKSWWQFW